MKNRIHIKSDGINAYADLEVIASKTGVRILGVFIALSITLITGLILTIKADEVKSMIFPLILIITLCLGLPLKYLLWNMYGVESLIVNTKTISWSYNYGFFQTNLKTVKYNILATGYEKVRGDGEREVGILVFYNYREEDNLPEVIHQTTVLLTKEEINIFDEQIFKIFELEFFNNKGFIPYSLN